MPSSVFLCVLCGVFFPLLAGCKTEEAARAEAPRVATVSTTELHPADRRPPPAPVPPLRRTPDCPQDDEGPDWLNGVASQDLLAVAAGSTVVPEGGAVRLRLALALPEDGGALAGELRQLGFTPEPPGAAGKSFWARTVAVEEGVAFEKQLLSRIEGTSRRLEHMLDRERCARQPGWIVWQEREAPDKFFPGKLVYTGHALDIALADAGAEPHLFFAVQSRRGPASPTVMYVRGGRLFVAEDWTLGLGEFKPAGEWRRVPFETERVSVRPDGQVLAFLHDGTSQELGLLRVVRLAAFKPAAREGAVESTAAPQAVALTAGESPLRAGHLEYSVPDQFTPAARALQTRRLLRETLRALNQPLMPPQAPAAPSGISGPIVIHADLTWTEQHLKALGVPVERTPGHTAIPLGHDSQKVVGALAKVLQVLSLRMAIHDQNLRNADRVRDAENRINPYRRKVIKIGPQGEAVEEGDSSPFTKVYKPGDPNADADGYITQPNVNRALETAEFQAAAEEYKLVRACLERLAPQQIFPDPPPPPPKPEGR